MPQGCGCLGPLFGQVPPGAHWPQEKGLAGNHQILGFLDVRDVLSSFLAGVQLFNKLDSVVTGIVEGLTSSIKIKHSKVSACSKFWSTKFQQSLKQFSRLMLTQNIIYIKLLVVDLHCCVWEGKMWIHEGYSADAEVSTLPGHATASTSRCNHAGAAAPVLAVSFQAFNASCVLLQSLKAPTWRR